MSSYRNTEKNPILSPIVEFPKQPLHLINLSKVPPSPMYHLTRCQVASGIDQGGPITKGEEPVLAPFEIMIYIFKSNDV